MIGRFADHGSITTIPDSIESLFPLIQPRILSDLEFGLNNHRALTDSRLILPAIWVSVSVADGTEGLSRAVPKVRFRLFTTWCKPICSRLARISLLYLPSATSYQRIPSLANRNSKFECPPDPKWRASTDLVEEILSSGLRSRCPNISLRNLDSEPWIRHDRGFKHWTSGI